MKKKLTIILSMALVMSLPVFGQEADTTGKKLEINFGVSNIFSRPLIEYILYDDYYDFYYPDYFFGNLQTSVFAGFKSHTKSGALRFNTGFSYNSQKSQDSDNDDYNYEIQITQGYINLGYEWHTNFKRVTFFYGFDIGSTYLKYMDKSEDSDSKSKGEYTSYYYGIKPLIGINYYLTSHFSIGTEIKFDVSGYSGKSKSKYTYDYPDFHEVTYEHKYSGVRAHFAPLGHLSFNIHF